MSRRSSTTGSAIFASHQTYKVKCSCGEVLMGERRRQAQSVPCPNCGSALFILPEDCYRSATRVKQGTSNRIGKKSRGLVDNLNRLAFWTRLRKRRLSIGQALRNFGQWIRRSVSRRR